MIKCRKYFNSETMHNLYNTLVLPFLSYCIHVWGKAAEIHSNKIFILQKKAVRLIAGVPPRTPSQPLFRRLSILALSGIYRYYVGMHMYKVYHSKEMPTSELFKRTSIVHDYETKQSNRFILNSYRRSDHKRL